MKILQLTNKVPYPPRDGGAIASLALARGLAGAGHDVVLLAMNTTKHFVDVGTHNDAVEAHNHAPLYIPMINNLRWEIVPVDTRIRWHKALANLLFSRLPYNAVRFISADYRLRLINLLKAETFDFIILENLYTVLYLDDIRNHCATPVLFRPHNVEHEIWERTVNMSSGLKKLYLNILAARIRRFELSCINRYEAIIPITRRDGDRFSTFGNRKPMHVLPTGIQFTTTPEPAETGGEKNVAHLGALDWMPNQDGIRWFLNRVWPLVKQQIPEAGFFLAGRNCPTGFAKEVQSSGATYLGEIEDAEDFIRQHPVFIVPLFSGSGMRIKLLDYMSLGKAVVSTSTGAEGIPVTSGRECLIADDPEEFADAIVKLLHSPETRREIGKNASTFVKEKYDNRELISRFIEFLSGIQ